MQFDITTVREQFPALQQQINGSTPVFFDGPGGSQVPQSVLDAMVGYLGRYNANLGGAYFSSQKTVELMQQAREAAVDLYNAESTEQIIFGPNATTLAFTFSRAISNEWQQGDEIIVTALDHYSNVSPWELAAAEKGVTVRQVRVNEADCSLDLEHLASLLNERTRLVALTCASNTTGSIVDLDQAIRIIRANSKALCYLDAVHFAPHKAIDVQALDCDFLVSSAYKYFGPHLGILYGRKEHLEQLTPYKVAPAKDVNPGRWETGTQNFEALAGFVAAVEYLASLSGSDLLSRRKRLCNSYEMIEEYEQKLSAYFLDRLQRYSNIRLYGVATASRCNDRTPTFAFRIDGIEPRAVSEFFGQHHLCIWDGNFYAQGLYEQLGLTDIGGVVRVGCMHYNTFEELDQFFNLLDQFLQQ